MVLGVSKPFPLSLSATPCSALCLLPLGCINPVLQLRHDMEQRNAAPALPPAGDLLGTALFSPAASPGLHEVCPQGNLRDSMLFDDMWSWCQSCKHGGHLSHLAEWFSSKTVCPVAECMCHCLRLDHVNENGSRGGWQSNSMRQYGMSFAGGSVRLPPESYEPATGTAGSTSGKSD